MRTLATLVAVVVAIAVTARTGDAATVPTLRLVSQQPLTVRGEGFRPTERVVVTALTSLGPKRVVVRAVKGRFRATFRLVDQPCGDAFAVRALGARGSRAWVDVASRPCVPPPID